MLDVSVLAVLTNYARPQNLPQIVRALRRQTHPVKIVIVDNSPAKTASEDGDQHDLTRIRKSVDDIWRFEQNAGPPCRFAPAFMQHDCSHILFLDDDMLPGFHAVEHLVNTATQLKNEFATLGEFGRRFHGGNRSYMQGFHGRGEWRYVCRNVKRGHEPTPVDMTCCAHFVRADMMQHVLSFKWDMIHKHGCDEDLDGDRRGWWREDDMLLSLGIQQGTGLKSYLTPMPRRRVRMSLRQRMLAAPHAHSSRPHHLQDRTRFIHLALQSGWQSLWHGDKTH